MKPNNELKWVTEARIAGEYMLELTFNDGQHRLFDCAPLIEKYDIYAPLRDKKLSPDSTSTDGQLPSSMVPSTLRQSIFTGTVSPLETKPFVEPPRINAKNKKVWR